MTISTLDMRCRYIAAPGTKTESLSPFGDYLKSLGVIVLSDCSLDYMVRSGWIQPALRVALSRPALESWENFPELSMRGTDKCPEGEEWSLSLWANSVTGPMPPIGNAPNWWIHFLDDVTNPLTQTIRDHAIDPSESNALPACFTHARRGEEIKPWIDFFAYWQAYQLAELLAAATGKFYVTPGFEKRLEIGSSMQLEIVEMKARRIKKRWEKRRSTFEWLSRFRTILAAGINRNWDDVIKAAKLSADQQRLPCRRVMAKIRNTLLVMWQDWDRIGNMTPSHEKLRELLRQDIEYALCFSEMLSGHSTNFLAPCWTYPDRSQRRWAQLIDALPKDSELARKRFPYSALMYLDEHASAAPRQFPIDAKSIDELLSKSWDKSRPLRRFCLAFFRLHQELGDRGRTSGEKVIRSNEVIEQLITTVLSAEKLLVAIHRKRNPNPNGRYQETRKVLKDQLCFVLGKFNLTKNGIGTKAMAETGRLLKERSELHDLDARGRQIFVTTAEINSGSKEADYFAAAHVNFLIARNYAAHHDSRDEDFVVPNELDVSEHLGNVALKSTLTLVITCLQTTC